MPILMRILPEVLRMLENHNFYLLLVTVLLLYSVLSFSSMLNVSYVFSILDRIPVPNKIYKLFHLLGTDTDPDRPDPDLHALDAGPVLDAAK
jgi:hypothetical protein